MYTLVGWVTEHVLLSSLHIYISLLGKHLMLNMFYCLYCMHTIVGWVVLNIELVLSVLQRVDISFGKCLLLCMFC